MSTSQETTTDLTATTKESQTQQNQDTATPKVNTLSVEEIYRILPHRYPFALVDRIIEYIPKEKAVGIKNVTFNEPHFQGHFPGRPIMPGVLIMEALAQVAGIIFAHKEDIK